MLYSLFLDQLKISSTILKEELAFIMQLQKWLGEKCKWNLCYRASRDGWSAQAFHRHCGNKGPTVVLIKANNCIFGGYTDKNWGGTVGMVIKMPTTDLFCCTCNYYRMVPYHFVFSRAFSGLICC